MTIKYLKNLDGVRAIAALLVLVYHAFQNLDLGQRYAPFIENMAIMGHFGVALFFVLSGFLITRILFKTKDDDGYFKKFYLRRALRILPLYYLFLLLWYFVMPLFTKEPLEPFGKQLYFYTYSQGIPLTFNWPVKGPGHFWSLGVEEYFYFFWPVVIYFLNKKNVFNISLLLIVVALITKWILIAHSYNDAFLPLARFDALAMGAILALVEQKNIFRKENAFKFLLVMFVFMILTLLCCTNFILHHKDNFAVLKWTLIGAIGFGMIGYILCLPENHFWNRILRNRFFSFSGKISYGLYVYYPMAFAITALYLPLDQWITTGLMSIAFVYLVATLSYYIVEMPFLKLKKFFKYQ